MSRLQVSTTKKFPTTKKNNTYAKSLTQDIIKYRGLYLMLVPVILNFIIFHYVPIYGLQIAFKRYNLAKGILHSPWVGFEHFIKFFGSYHFPIILRNTISLSLLLIVVGFPLPIILALLFNEIRYGPFKKITQSISYLPHFVSSVVVVGLALQILSPSGGVINMIINALGKKSIYFMGEPKYFRMIYVFIAVWRDIGFGSIIYVAAITSLDFEMYESAIIDGASRFKRMLYITLPAIKPTIVILFILRLGRVLNVGFWEILLLQNPLNNEVSEVIETFVYKRGLENANYSFGAAIGLLNSVVGLIFVLGSNYLIKKTGEDGIF